MKQFVIIAEDGTDAEALDRRMTARPSHLEGVRNLKMQGHYVTGGATLDPLGKMNGSVMIVQFENEQDLQHWLDSEPYISGKVWNKLRVLPFKVADI